MAQPEAVALAAVETARQLLDEAGPLVAEVAAGRQAAEAATEGVATNSALAVAARNQAVEAMNVVVPLAQAVTEGRDDISAALQAVIGAQAEVASAAGIARGLLDEATPLAGQMDAARAALEVATEGVATNTAQAASARDEAIGARDQILPLTVQVAASREAVTAIQVEINAAKAEVVANRAAAADAALSSAAGAAAVAVDRVEVAAARDAAVAAKFDAVAVMESSGKWLSDQGAIEADATLSSTTPQGTIVRTLDGYAYQVLPPEAPSYARLTSAGVKLGVRGDKGEWYAKAFDIRDVGTDQRAKIQKMTDSGESSFVFEPTNDRLVVDGNVTLRAGLSLRGGRFDQKTVYCQTFDIPKGADGVRARDMNFVGSYTRNGAIDTTLRGGGANGQSCAIWTTANDGLFENITVSNMYTGVYFSCWDPTANNVVPGVTGNTLRNFRCKNSDFGVVATGQYGISLIDLYGEDIVLSPGSPNPGHLVYLTGWTNTRNKGVTIQNSCGRRTNDQTILQVKFSDGVNIQNLYGYDAALISITGSTKVEVDGITGEEITDLSGAGAVYVFCQNDDEANVATGVEVRGANFKMKSGTTRPVYMLGNGNKFKGRIDTNRPSGTFSDGAVHVLGCDNEVDVDVVQSGAGTQVPVRVRTSAIFSAGTKRNRIKVRGVAGVQVVKMDDSGVQDTVIEYDPRLISTLPGVPMFSDHAATRTVVKRSPNEITINGTGGSFGSINGGVFTACSHTRAIFSIGDANAYTIPAIPGSATTGTPVGTEFEIVIKNTTASALGTISWNALYDLKAAYTAPAGGKRTVHRLRWSGSLWEEL